MLDKLNRLVRVRSVRARAGHPARAKGVCGVRVKLLLFLSACFMGIPSWVSDPTGMSSKVRRVRPAERHCFEQRLGFLD
jgi:hypothetical protein